VPRIRAQASDFPAAMPKTPETPKPAASSKPAAPPPKPKVVLTTPKPAAPPKPASPGPISVKAKPAASLKLAASPKPASPRPASPRPASVKAKPAASSKSAVLITDTDTALLHKSKRQRVRNVRDTGKIPAELDARDIGHPWPGLSHRRTGSECGRG